MCTPGEIDSKPFYKYSDHPIHYTGCISTAYTSLFEIQCHV